VVKRISNVINKNKTLVEIEYDSLGFCNIRSFYARQDK
jgi:hypothetical protein